LMGRKLQPSLSFRPINNGGDVEGMRKGDVPGIFLTPS
jgi:hypothetical protein